MNEKCLNFDIGFFFSVINKFRLKCVLALHALLLLLMFFKVFEDILDQFDIDWGPLERLQVPMPNFWEYWWLFSLIPLVFAFLAMPRNNDKRMSQSYYGMFLFGLIPVAAGAGHKLPTIINYVKNPQDDDVVMFLNFPLVVLEYAFFAVAFQIHAFTMYFESQLIKSWQPVVNREPAPPATDLADGHLKNAKKHN